MDAQGERYADWMRGHLGVLHRISRAFAEPADQPDLMQELMLAVWRAAPSFRGDSTPATFIHRVAHNRAMTWRRRETGRRLRTAAAQEEWRMQSEAPEEASDAALLDRLYAAIRKLGPLDRSLVLLSLEGVAYREMAQLHALSESNVGVRLNRARTRISALVGEDRNGF